MRSCGLSDRLLSAAELVRQDAVFADIGTDHAYLPLFLLERGRIKRAFCSDINEGPLEKARENAKRRGFSDKITFLLSDGANLLPSGEITDYAICGMGGELIADIISRCEDFKRRGVNLILQPMSKVAYLRQFLYESGFEIGVESYSEDDGKLYVVFLVKYTANVNNIDADAAEIPSENAEIVNKNLQKEYLERKKAAFSSIIEGKKAAGVDSKREKSILRAIDEYLEKG